MLLRFTTPLLVSSLLVGCGCPTRGSGVRTEVSREIEAFSTLDVDNSLDVFVRVGEAPTAKVGGDDNLVELVETEVVGDVLHVRTRGSYLTSGGLEVYLTTPALDRIEVSGSGTVKADGIDADAVVFEVSGSGDLVASGKASTLTVALSGNGTVDATELPADDVKVSVSGNGNAKVTADATLRAEVSGNGSIRYRGEPSVDKDVSGNGSVTPL